MSVVTNALNGLDGNTDDYRCEKCNETFTKRKYLKRHLETCQAALEEEESTSKQKGHPCIKCDSTFRKVKTLNLHLREDHDIDPDTLPSNSNENIENEAEGNNAEELVAKSDENNAQDETEDNNMEVADEDVDKELDVSTSVDDLTDAVTAYQQAIEITPMIEEGDQPLEFNEQQQKEDAQDEVVVDEDGDTNEDVTDEMVIDGWAISDDDDPKLIKMTKLLKKSPYFKSRRQSCKRYVQTEKSFMTIEDPSLPEGFRVFEQMRSTGRHIDREFVTPDGFFVLRSKVACTEYAKLMEQAEEEEEGNDSDSAEVIESDEDEDNVVEVTSPAKRPSSDSLGNPAKKQKSYDFGPASFKSKLQKKLNETKEKHMDVIKCLPRGTKIRFAPGSVKSNSGPEPVIKTSRGVTITPIPDVERVSTPTSLSSRSSNLKCCGRTFISEAGFQKHKEREHGRSKVNNVAKNVPKGVKITPVDGSQKSDNVPKRGSAKVAQTKVHKCSHCENEFSSKGALYQHNREKHTTVKCGDCKENFPTRLSMLEHTKAEHINPCKICKNVFRLKSKLQEHEDKIHSNTCSICSENFNFKAELKTHFSEKHEVKCNFCTEVLSSKAKLDEHYTNVHKNCAECEDEFSWPDEKHKCWYTQNNVTPASSRVEEQRLYRGYFYFGTRDD